MSNDATDFAIVKVEVALADRRTVSKGFRFANDEVIEDILIKIYNTFMSVGVELEHVASSYSLFYEPFSESNSLLQQFLSKNNSIEGALSSKDNNKIEISQSMWRQMAHANIQEKQEATPSLQGTRKMRSSSIDLHKLRTGFNSTNSSSNGFWLDESKAIGDYKLPKGTQLSFIIRIKDKAQNAEKQEAKNFMRVYDKKGSYKTLFIKESTSVSELCDSLSEKFNVNEANAPNYGLFIKKSGKKSLLVPDAKPILLLNNLSAEEVDKLKFVYKKASDKERSTATAGLDAVDVRETKKKEEIEKAIQGRINHAKKKGLLDLSFQKMHHFPDEFFMLESLDTLTLNSTGLTCSSLPNLSHFTSLTVLRLVKNKFVSIPEEITSLATLTELDLGNNFIKEIPPSLASLSSLRELYLYVNCITEIADCLTSLDQLIVLNVAHNNISSIPAKLLPNMCSIGQLKVAGNKLTDIPVEIKYLSRLVDLNVSRNKIAKVPAEVGELFNLRWLNVKSNELTEIPSSLCKLPVLEELLISDNQITILPATFKTVQILHAKRNKISELPANLALDSVIELDLNENELTMLPNTLPKFGELQKLSITNNKLEALPEHFCSLTKLTQLDAKHNRLKYLPQDIGNMEFIVIDIAHNKITELPDSFYEVKKLWYCHIAGNPLASLPDVDYKPPYLQNLFVGNTKISSTVIENRIANLAMLRTLDIGYCGLDYLSPAISVLTKLKLLFLSGNNLTRLPQELCSLPLKELHLANNKLDQLPPNIGEFKATLEILDLSSNNLKEISILLELYCLKWLDISCNPLPGVPPEFSSFKHLEELCADNVPGNNSSHLLKLSHGSKERGDRFQISWSDLMGRRDGMEDSTTFKGSLLNNKLLDTFCVLDGHGGRRVASRAGAEIIKLLEKRLPEVLVTYLKNENGEDITAFDTNDPVNDDAVLQCLRTIFHDVQALIGKLEIGVMEGATAVASLFVHNRLFIANVGDTRAVLCRGDGTALRLSYDHKPDLPEEEQRIRALGGFVGDDQRVNAVLAVSRAFGDFALDPYVLCDPFMSRINLDEGDQFLIIACDGVWDVMSDQEAVDLVKNTSIEQRAIALRDHAYMFGSMDNISAVIINFQEGELPKLKDAENCSKLCIFDASLADACPTGANEKES